MSTYAVIRKSDQHQVYGYQADAPIEWTGMEFETHDHVVAPITNDSPNQPGVWRIYVGAFFDRFGSSKLAILSSTDPIVEALIKDASVRQYIDLTERRDELLAMVGLLHSKGFDLDPVALLDLEPTADEVWNG